MILHDRWGEMYCVIMHKDRCRGHVIILHDGYGVMYHVIIHGRDRCGDHIV